MALQSSADLLRSSLDFSQSRSLFPICNFAFINICFYTVPSVFIFWSIYECHFQILEFINFESEMVYGLFRSTSLLIKC